MTSAQFLAELAVFAVTHGRSPRDEPRDRAAFWWILGAVILFAAGVGVLIRIGRPALAG